MSLALTDKEVAAINERVAKSREKRAQNGGKVTEAFDLNALGANLEKTPLSLVPKQPQPASSPQPGSEGPVL